MAKNFQYVGPLSDGWAMCGAGNQVDSSYYSAQRDSIGLPRVVAGNQGSELLNRGKNGRIREHGTEGTGPRPPKEQ